MKVYQNAFMPSKVLIFKKKKTQFMYDELHNLTRSRRLYIVIMSINNLDKY